MIGSKNVFAFSRLCTVGGKTLRNMSSCPTEDLTDFACNGKKIVGAALNYMDIVHSRKVPVPQAPLLFLKPSTSYIQVGQDIVIPKVFSKVAFEVELGVVIGRRCKNVSKANAMQYVGGYCLALDLTAQCELGKARASGHPWSLGKGFDTSTPVSRFMTCDEIKDPQNVHLWLKLNGEERQNGNTSEMIFKVADLISFASQYMTLEPRDLILTGTPDGAAPMKAGDVIECGLGKHQMCFNVCGEN